MKSILDAVPSGWQLRPEQREILLQIEAAWKTSEVICVVMPTGSGKSLVSLTIARWQAARGKDSAIITPTNLLVSQFAESFPEVPVLYRADAYRCEPFKRSCATTKRSCRRTCPDCPYAEARREAKAADIAVSNTFVYWSQKLFAHTLIADEAHTLVDMLAEKKEVRIWQRQYNFPSGLRTVADVIQWAQGELKRRGDERLEILIKDVIRLKDSAVIEYTHAQYRGQMQPMLLVRQPSASHTPPWLWPSKVRKIVLLSATTGPEDVRELGLANRRVAYLSCDAPIPAERRPVIYSPCYNMAYQYRAYALPHLAKHIQELLAANPGKGLIHLPYAVAEQAQTILNDPRLMWHSRDNKAAVLEQFRQSDPAVGRTLVASGLYEGIDLPYSAATWQLIGVIPWASLADERIKKRAEEDPSWLDWQTLKKVIQAAGRIVRATDDFGTTHIGDINFETLLRRDRQRAQPLIPAYFKQAIIRR